MEKKSKILIAIIAAAAVIVIAVAVVLALGVFSGGSYGSQVERGQTYLDSGDYDKAIEAFKKAIEQDENDEEAYIGLATAYHNNSLFALARQTLEGGLLHVDSSRMRQLLLDWFGVGGDDQVISIGDKEDVPAETEAETTTVLETETAEEGASYSSCQLTGRVADVITGDGMSGVTIKAYKGTGRSGDPEEIVTDSSGKYTFELESGNYYVVFEKLGYKDLTEQIYVSPSAAKTFFDAEMYEEGLNLITGRVIDAASGYGVAGVLVTAYSSDGTYIGETTTDSSGNYSIPVRGYTSYKIVVSMEGYIDENLEVRADEDNLKIVEDVALSQELADDEIRIVLTWGSYPTDLDSYLSGNASDGTSTFIKFSHRSETDRSGNKIAELDLDDRDGYGPETTTVYDIYGSYEFYVVDYNVTESMAEMGATVKIYKGSSLVHTVDIASDVVNVWSVFKINNGEIQITNEAKNISLTPGAK